MLSFKDRLKSKLGLPVWLHFTGFINSHTADEIELMVYDRSVSVFNNINNVKLINGKIYVRLYAKANQIVHHNGTIST